LIVDDELSIRESFNLILSDKYRVIVAASGEAAVKYVADQKIALVYLDIRMPGLNGIETLKKIKEIEPSQEVIMVTAVNDVQKASEAIKLGARDYVVKPFDVKHILTMTEDLIRRKNLFLASKAVSLPEEEILLSNSEKIANLKRLIRKLKKMKSWILIMGEEGVEKERVAQALAEDKFFSLDLRLKNPNTLKRLLFGISSGGTVTSLEKETGLIEEARGGTLFLDNVEGLPEALQKSLARQELGLKLICGTAVNLKEQDFNKELFEKITEEIIELPPLRERLSDIKVLAQSLLEKANLKYNKSVREFSPAALDVLMSYDWPGNVHELEGMIENLALSLDSPIVSPEDLPLSMICGEGSFYALSFEDGYSRFEKDYIQHILERTNADKKLASEILGIKPAVLEAKLS